MVQPPFPYSLVPELFTRLLENFSQCEQTIILILSLVELPFDYVRYRSATPTYETTVNNCEIKCYSNYFG